MEQTITPSVTSLRSLGTRIPYQLQDDVRFALGKLTECVGGSLVGFVCDRLRWSAAELVERLSEEQVEAVALIIYNFEARRQAAIIGDQTGVGKGRVAAAVIRYGALRGQKPIFVTDKANLFTDIYRDLSDIGCASLRPFIISSNSNKASVRKMNDESDDAVFRPLSAEQQEAVFKTEGIPEEFDYVMTTYSQFSQSVVQKVAAAALGVADRGGASRASKSAEQVRKDSLKQNYLKKIARGNILILDESHSAAGNSNRGSFFREAEMCAANVCFLSATYSKRPENMALYVPRTCVSETGLKSKELDAAISQGGEAMQEVMSSCIVRNGQMIRREYDNSGVKVNYLTLSAKGHLEAAESLGLEVEDLEEEHVRLADKMMAIVERIVMLDRLIGQEFLDIAQKSHSSSADEVRFTRSEYIMRVFNIVNQILFALKAKAIARHAIRRLNEGKAVVVAFSNTMEAALSELNDNGVSVGDVIEDDFSFALKKDLESLLRYNEKIDDETVDAHSIGVSQLSPMAQQMYYGLKEDIANLKTGLSLSPIDTIARTIEYAGFKTAEVTGRRLCVAIDDEGNARLSNRVRENVNSSFARFQNNKVDALLVNRSGATGASVHAVETDVVSGKRVRQRLMVIAQMELDVNQEVQKRGRINRTGQTLLPEYDYLSTAIPAEQRLMLMMQKKLLSLDANTSANMHQSVDIINIPDMMNRFGDMATVEFFRNNPELQSRLGVDVNVKNDCTFRKVSGRIAILPVAVQKEFYDTVSEIYDDLVEMAKSEGRYDLDVESLPLNAKLIGRRTIEAPEPQGYTVFSDGIYLDTYECDNLSKPYTLKEIQAEIQKLRGQDNDDSRSAEDFAKDTYRHVLLEQCNYKKSVENKLIESFYAKVAEVLNVEKLSDADRDLYLQAANNQLSYKEMRNLNKATFPLMTTLRNALERQNGLYEMYKRRMVFIREFWGGRPLVLFSGADAMCLGVRLHATKEGDVAHYRPSDVTVIIAMTDSKRVLKYNLADAGLNVLSELDYIAYRSKYDGAPQNLMKDWTRLTTQYVADRRIRHIITGNLLKGFKLVKAYHGRLVKFTLADGAGSTNGILLPDTVKPEDIPIAMTACKVSAEKLKLIELIKNAAKYEQKLMLSGGVLMFLFVLRRTLKVQFVPMSSKDKSPYRELSKHIYAQTHLDTLVSSGDKLSLAHVRVEDLCRMLSDCGCSVMLTPEQAESVGQPAEDFSLRDGWWPRLPQHVLPPSLVDDCNLN